jgi:hypothetical protein
MIRELDNIKSIKAIEIENLYRLIKEIRQEYIQENVKNNTFEISKYEQFVTFSNLIEVILTLASMLDVGKGLFCVGENNRYNFDLREGAIRLFINHFTKGSFVNKALGLLGLDTTELIDVLSSFIQSIYGLASVYKNFLYNLQKYLEAHKNAAEIYNKYTGVAIEECYDITKCHIYANHKAFPETEDFENFLNSHGDIVAGTYNFIIFDLLNVIIDLDEKSVELIIKALADNTDGLNNLSVIKMVLSMQKALSESRDSGILDIFITFLESLTLKYIDDFQNRFIEIRDELYTKQEQENYVSLFESGALFTV